MGHTAPVPPPPPAPPTPQPPTPPRTCVLAGSLQLALQAAGSELRLVGGPLPRRQLLLLAPHDARLAAHLLALQLQVALGAGGGWGWGVGVRVGGR